MIRRDYLGNVLYKGELFRNNDDRYEFQYTDATGKTCHLYARTLPELRRKKEDTLGIMRVCSSAYRAGMITLNEAFDFYMLGKRNLKANTRDSYYYVYDRYVRPVFGTKQVGEYTHSELVFLYKSLFDQGFSISTMDNIQNVIYPTFQMLVDDGVLQRNPANNSLKELKRNEKITKGIRRALTPEQQATFLNYVRTDPACEKWRDIVIILFGTGLRSSEMFGLLWENIDFANRAITVDHAVVRNVREKGCPYHISVTKTAAGKRIIPMLDEVYDAFDRIYKKQEKEGWPKVVIDGLDDFIFVNKEGKLMNFQNLNNAIENMRLACNANNLQKKSGDGTRVPHFSTHVIRHTFCARLCEVETNIKVIQDIMGHSDIRTTMEVYAEVSVIKKKNTMMQHNNAILFLSENMYDYS